MHRHLSCAARAAWFRLGLALSGLAVISGTAMADSGELARAIEFTKRANEFGRQGRYPEAAAAAQQALALVEHALGPDDPLVAGALASLATFDTQQHRDAEAEPLYRRALAIREKTAGSESPETGAILNNLGALYVRQHRYAEAETALRRALAIKEKAGPDAPDLALGLGNLAKVYQEQQRYAEAEPLLRRALALAEKHGPDQPDVALYANSLASSYFAEERYAEAAPFYERAVAVQEKIHGPDSTELAVELTNLTLSYVKLKRYAEAQPLAARVVAIREKQAADPVELAKALDVLADIDGRLYRYTEAEPLYRRELAIRERQFGPRQAEVADTLQALAHTYHDLGRFDQAEPLLRRAVAIREKAPGPGGAELTRSLNQLATLYQEQGRFSDAEPLHRRILTIEERAKGPDSVDATTLDNLALVYDGMNRLAEAEPLYRRAMEIRQKKFGPDSAETAISLSNLAIFYANRGRYAEAEPMLLRVAAINEKKLPPGHLFIAVTLDNLGWLYRKEGRYADAERCERRALAEHEKARGRDHPSTANTLDNLGDLHLDEGRYDQAETEYKRSLAIREKMLGDDHRYVGTSLNNLAKLYLAQGRYAEALPLSRRAVAIITRYLSAGSTSRTAAADAERQANRLYFLNFVALAAADAGDDPERRAAAAPEAFQVGQMAQASSAAWALAGMAARFASAGNALAETIRERQDLAQRWQQLDATLVQAATKPAAERSVAEATLRKELAGLRTRLDALDKRIAQAFPQYAELSNPQPLELGAAQALLAPDEAMLVYLVGERESWLWALRRDRAQMYRLDVGAKPLAEAVSRLRERLDPGLNPDLAPFDAKRAFALYQKIVAPAADLLDGAHALFVVPDGALESLPLGVLVTREPAANPDTPADHRGIAWLAREHAVTVLPSAGSLRVLRRLAAGSGAADPFVGFGDPVLEGKPGNARGPALASLFRGATADVEAVRQLPPLPETADELRAVAREMGAGDEDLYLAERATEPALRQAGLERYRVIEFATHGLMSGDLRGLAEPALVLTPPKTPTPDDDGLLTASKVATLKLNADWVVLSACNTAASDGTPDAGGLSGLAKAFFYAGARSLLVSNWGVPSKPTVTLITGAFAALRQDPAIGRAEALRRAEMAMLDPASPPEDAHPMMWAPFVLAGEGGAGR